MKYKFKAKDIKTGELVAGNLVYVRQSIFRKGFGVEYKTKPMIVSVLANGGRIYIAERYYIDESTIELIKED